MVRPARQWFSPAREMMLVILLMNVPLMLYGLHLISNRWVVGVLLSISIPAATVKAFLDYRRKSS